MRIDVFTIFPELVDSYCSTGVLGRGRERGLAELRVHDLRAGAGDPRRSVDDSPFGGGPGMVLMCEPLFAAVEAADTADPIAARCSCSPRGAPVRPGGGRAS